METIKVKSPFDGKFLDEIKVSNKSDIDQALDEARTVYENQKMWLPKYERVKILEKTVEIMKSRKEDLTRIAAAEGGKPYMDSKVEVERAINGVKLAIEHLGVFEGKEIAMGHTESSSNRMAYTMKEPIGVVAAISAFNHPLNLAVHQTVPAIAVGSPVIIKPSETTPMSAINFVEILHEAGLPKAWCQVVVCHREEAQYLATHSKIDYLSFIGSGAVGWYLNSQVSPGTRVGLEHGGVAPVIVEADADMEALIPALAKGGFYHAGQVCVSVQRVYVHESICDEVASKLAKEAQTMIVGDPLNPNTEVGPLISHHEVDRVELWVNEAVQKGAKVLSGGKRISESCFEPTVLLNPPPHAKVSNLEVFGPVVCVYSYDDIEDAFREANSLEFSFQAAVFTKNIDTALLAVKRLNGTAVMVNDHTAFRVDWMPFGGAKASGLGLGGISYSMEEMSKEKLMVIKSPVL
ncbi:MAG: Non-phosphorylating glyceraldehyde-3-phosphate dehydrogenase (NADP) (EC [uncultured Sulfurovum sp.]|uniref:Non-phosphorylating glyceraldehyde-3-phosphate dehydrogenase (NADP) (EC) n=1 Tax=uncultured Sulfurovum sp. TaxID=269237 RepID=A0A6S6U4X4_9BACT|nr:MAG: Non-phosphorylating glyceraldehyde-3-phosphate dehydrogenase (NADP) (EC [uncultured Sulfurovum sp.]